MPDTSPPTWEKPANYDKVKDQRYDLKAQYAVDTRVLQKQNLLVHLNCISPSFIGNRFAQIMTIIPLNKTSAAYSEYEPTHLEYHKVNTNNLSRVNFKLLNTDGSMPVFEYPLMKHNYCYQTNYTLSFRKRNK